MSDTCRHFEVTRGTRQVGPVSFGLLQCRGCGRVRLEEGDDWVTLDGDQADVHLLAMVVRSLQLSLVKQWTFR